MKQGIILYFLALTISIQAQTFSTNSSAIDEYRYEGIKGSPYVLDDFSQASIFDKDGNEIKDAMVNYNAFDPGVEVRKDNRVTILDEDFYPKVVIKQKAKKKGNDTEMVLVPSPQSTMKGTYVQELYSSDDVKFYKKFRIVKSNNKTEIPGKTEVTQRFSLKSEYLINHGAELKQVKGKLDSVTAIIGNKKELKNYCKKNKNKLKSDQDWKDLFTYHSTL